VRRATLATLFALVLALTFGAPARADGWVSDAWITAKAKIALLTTQGLTATDVSVDTLAGHVSLHGKVPAASDKQTAEEAVKQIDGVRSVKNLLQIVPPEHAAAVEATDATVRSAVEAALAADRGLAGTAITVTSVTNGVVLLGGTAANSAEHLRALEMVRRVRGVRRVETNVATAANDASLDIWSRRELRQDGRGVLDVASDLWLSAETRLRLIADPRVPAPDISVDCRDQTVTLFGAVPSGEAKKAAEDDARAVEGVREVRNEIQVVPATKRAKTDARDAELAQNVTAAIFSRPEMNRASISVDVKNGVVRLSGTVPSQQHRIFAASAAREVPGVRAVTEDLRISSITETAPEREAPARNGPAAPAGS
jgi:osmotically-inducible protein OsmY